MKRQLFLFAFMATAFLSAFDVQAQTVNKYFGYFYNDAYSSVAMTAKSFDENYAHINLYHIDTFIIGNNTVDRDATIAYTLGELAKAKARGVRAIITATPFVLHWTDRPESWSAEPNAVAVWRHFVDELVGHGYIVPGNTQASTVAAIYAIDEPNNWGLGDVRGGANSTLVAAVNAIRSDERISGIPLASIMGADFLDEVPQGLKLFDWVGFDQYDLSWSRWLGQYNALKGMLPAGKRTILVPKAAYGNGISGGTSLNDPDQFNDLFESDEKAVWLVPFKWFSSSDTTGVRDIPSLRSAYTRIGGQIKLVGCQSSLAERAYCLGGGRRGVIGAALQTLLAD